MKTSFFYVLLLLLLSPIGNNCFSQTAPVFEMSYFEDVSSTHSFESVKQEDFKPVPEHIISLGIIKSTIWVKVILNTKMLKSNAILEIDRALLDSITVSYRLKDAKQIKETLGIMFPASKNKQHHFLPSFEIPTNQLASKEVYLKIKSRWAMLIPISVKVKEDFNKERVNRYLISGLLIGGLFFMGIYNLFLYFSTRDFNYILYVLALFSAILSQGYIFGVLIYYLSPEHPEFSFRFPVIIMAFTGIFCCLFAIRFLEIKKTSKVFYVLLLISIALLSFNVIIELLHLDYFSRKIIILLIILTSFIIFSSAVYSLIKGKKTSLYFTIAWTFYLTGMVIHALKAVGILPHNNFTEHFMHVGTFMEVMLLSFALGHKYYLVRVEKEKLERQSKAELELLVKEQTFKLEASLEEKEVLLKEIHHRVKNNLQIVISILDLQVASIKETKNKEILAQSKSRVYSMSLIHQKLYQSNNLARVNMKDYLEELFTYVLNSYQSTNHKTHTELRIENKELSLTKVVPLGLVFNELLTNSIKHGLKTSKIPKIKIVLAVSKNILVLEIADSGKGFDFNKIVLEIKKSLGLFLVKSLTKQLRGTLKHFYTDDLFVTQLTIPLDNVKK